MPVALRITGDGAAFLDPGQTRFMQATVLMSDSSVVPVESDLSWVSRDTARASMLPSGEVRAGDVIGATWLVARHLGLVDSFAIWVQPPPNEPSTFHIKIVYLDDLAPDWWKAALDEAARRWERVIRRPLVAIDPNSLTDHCQLAQNEIVVPPLDAEERGVVILVRTSREFPPNTYVEALGGPCRMRPHPASTTVVGRITLNGDWFRRPIADDRLAYVAHHEIGHVLGLADAIQDSPPPHIQLLYEGALSAGSLNHGPFTRYGFFITTGKHVAGVPADNGGHWIGSGDVMGTTPSGIIGLTSIGALMDLGYTATAHGAGLL